MIIEVNVNAAHAATGGVEHDASLPAVVLIHGAGMDCTVWSLQTRYLAYRGFRVFALDLPGHGLSEGETIESIEEMATWVSQFLTAAGIESAHLVGHSMGTFIALEVAANTAPKVDSIVLMGTAPAMPVHPQLIADAETNLPAAAALMVAWSHDKPAHFGLNPTPGLWMVGGGRALVERSKPGVLASDFRACAAYENAINAAQSVTCAATVMIGSGDKMTPAKAGKKLAEHLDAASVVLLKDTGHMMMIESASEVKRCLMTALKAC